MTRNTNDLTSALVAIARGYSPEEVAKAQQPTIAEQMADLIRPGRTVAFRTESGSYYELVVYIDRPTQLFKSVNDRPELKATGEMKGTRDRRRGVFGVLITEESGRTYTTSAIVKVWLAYDAIEGESHPEPD